MHWGWVGRYWRWANFNLANLACISVDWSLQFTLACLASVDWKLQSTPMLAKLARLMFAHPQYHPTNPQNYWEKLKTQKLRQGVQFNIIEAGRFSLRRVIQRPNPLETHSCDCPYCLPCLYWRGREVMKSVWGDHCGSRILSVEKTQIQFGCKKYWSVNGLFCERIIMKPICYDTHSERLSYRIGDPVWIMKVIFCPWIFPQINLDYNPMVWYPALAVGAGPSE